jgi:hypothetical protein
MGWKITYIILFFQNKYQDENGKNKEGIDCNMSDFLECANHQKEAYKTIIFGFLTIDI